LREDAASPHRARLQDTQAITPPARLLNDLLSTGAISPLLHPNLIISSSSRVLRADRSPVLLSAQVLLQWGMMAPAGFLGGQLSPQCGVPGSASDLGPTSGTTQSVGYRTKPMQTAIAGIALAY
jgi:hypothetical protein